MIFSLNVKHWTLDCISWLLYPDCMNTIEKNLRSHVNTLASDIGSRSILEESNLRKAQEYIHGQFAEIGLEVIVQDYSAHGTATANLLAAFQTISPGLPYLLLGAHYDTVPGTPGADDNASAVALMLEVARLISGDRHPCSDNIIFAAFSTEEPPSFNSDQMGSRVFVKSRPSLGLSIAGAVILEMVGYFSDEPGTQKIPVQLKLLGLPDKGSFIAVVGNGKSRSLVRDVSRGIRESGCALQVQSVTVPGSGSLLPEIRLSDNASFWDAGLPAVMITDTSFFRNPHYHRHSDRPETLDYIRMEQLVLGLAHFFKE
jgi:hypothetical protein